MVKRKRSASVSELLNTHFKVMDFKGEWLELFGKPQLSGCWLVWGESANGKTSFMLQLCKYLAEFGRVAYNSIEEGISESFKQACIKQNMIEAGCRFQILDKEPIEELIERLKKKKSPDIIVIDSVQYTELTKTSVKDLLSMFPKKLFIFVSHAKGKLPDGNTANKIRFHADVKIRVEGYTAKIESRFGGDKSMKYTIWHEGAAEYWGNTQYENTCFDRFKSISKYS